MNNDLCIHSESRAFYEAGKSEAESFLAGVAEGMNSPSEYWLEISRRFAEETAVCMETFSKDPCCIEVQRIINKILSGEDG